MKTIKLTVFKGYDNEDKLVSQLALQHPFNSRDKLSIKQYEREFYKSHRNGYIKATHYSEAPACR